MKKNKLYFSALGFTLLVMIMACNKNNPYDTVTPPAQAHFMNATIGTYFVKNDPNSTFKIPVGVTVKSGSSRTINYTVTSPTGAASGTQYTLPASTVTIQAGNVVDSLTVKGLFAGFPGVRVDTLTFKITGGDLAASDYNSTYKLVMRKYCDVISTNLVGSYASSRDYDRALTGAVSGAKYSSSVSNWTPLTATSASVTIKNLAATSDIGFGPFAANEPIALNGVTAILDWTNPANFTVTIASQPFMLTTFGYGPSTISGTGSFSSCDQTITVSTIVRVSAGTFSAVVSTLIK
ncbi:MAG: hypothetical protein ACOYLT_09215 [Flavobacterium sp.]|uniref:hypothetical protein n=1 Tax=Flavobacterium sp. TaxID=239 RepID=UPI003BE61416